MSKLTDEQIQEIREAYASGGANQAELAAEFGTSQPYISLITRGKARPGAGGPVSDGIARRGHRVLNTGQVLAIREAYAEGDVTQAELAREYEVSQMTVSQIVRGQSYMDVGGPIVGAGKGRMFSKEQVQAIRRAAEVGDLSQRALARRFGERYDVHPDTIRRIIRGETYMNV